MRLENVARESPAKGTEPEIVRSVGTSLNTSALRHTRRSRESCAAYIAKALLTCARLVHRPHRNIGEADSGFAAVVSPNTSVDGRMSARTRPYDAVSSALQASRPTINAWAATGSSAVEVLARSANRVSTTTYIPCLVPRIGAHRRSRRCSGA